PWYAPSYSGAAFALACIQAVPDTRAFPLDPAASAHEVVVGAFLRRTPLVLATAFACGLILLAAPRRRFPRLAVIGAALGSAAASSPIVYEDVLTVAGGLRWGTKENWISWLLVAEVLACGPVALGVLAT